MGISEDDNYGNIQYGSSVDYSQSSVKQVVDAWKDIAVKNGDTAIARLITNDDLLDNLGFDHGTPEASWINVNSEYTPSWVYNHSYWTMTPVEDSNQYVWAINPQSQMTLSNMGLLSTISVRPVLELNKSADITKVN